MVLFFSYNSPSVRLPRTELFELSNPAWRSRALAGARARAPPLLLALARRCRRSSASVAQAAGLVDARRDRQLVCSSRPAATSCCAARAVMLVLARACSPPGDGLSARRWHPELDASSIAPSSSREGPALCSTAHNWHLHTAHEDGHGFRSGGLQPDASTFLALWDRRDTTSTTLLSHVVSTLDTDKRLMTVEPHSNLSIARHTHACIPRPPCGRHMPKGLNPQIS